MHSTAGNSSSAPVGGSVGGGADGSSLAWPDSLSHSLDSAGEEGEEGRYYCVDCWPWHRIVDLLKAEVAVDGTVLTVWRRAETVWQYGRRRRRQERQRRWWQGGQHQQQEASTNERWISKAVMKSAMDMEVKAGVCTSAGETRMRRLSPPVCWHDLTSLHTISAARGGLGEPPAPNTAGMQKPSCMPTTAQNSNLPPPYRVFACDQDLPLGLHRLLQLLPAATTTSLSSGCGEDEEDASVDGTWHKSDGHHGGNSCNGNSNTSRGFTSSSNTSSTSSSSGGDGSSGNSSTNSGSSAARVVVTVIRAAGLKDVQTFFSQVANIGLV